MTANFWVAVASLSAVVALGVWLGWSLLRTLRSNLAAECAELKQRVSDLTFELERAREVAQDERARRERYFDKISDMEKERSGWQRSYYDQSIGHGNAQELMMSVIDGLANQVKSLGGRPRVPSILQAVRDDFMANHEMPSKAALAAPPAPPVTVSEAPAATEPPATDSTAAS